MHRPPCGVLLSRSRLRALGWSDAAISRAVRSGRLHRVRHGWFIAGEDPAGGLPTALAAHLACAGSAISHRSALLLHGLPDLGRPAPPELTVAPRGTGHVPGAKIYRASFVDTDVVRIGSAAVLGVARTLIDVARHRPVLAAVAALDAALHAEQVTLEELDEVVARCRNWPRIGRARAALRLVDPLAESPLESVSRVVMGWLGLPAPRPQRVILDEHGRFVGRVDFYWDEFGVVGEADGRAKYRDSEVLDAEKERQDALGDLDLQVARWGWRHAVHERQVLRHRVEHAFARGRARDRAGLRRKWSVAGP